MNPAEIKAKTHTKYKNIASKVIARKDEEIAKQRLRVESMHQIAQMNQKQIQDMKREIDGFDGYLKARLDEADQHKDIPVINALNGIRAAYEIHVTNKFKDHK